MIILYYIIGILIIVIVYLIILLKKKREYESTTKNVRIVETLSKVYKFKSQREVGLRKIEDITKFGNINMYKNRVFNDMEEELIKSIPVNLFKHKETELRSEPAKLLLEIELEVLEPFKE